MKKKFLSFLLLAVGLLMSTSGWAYDGTGTPTDPYKVGSVADLTDALSKGGNIELIAAIGDESTDGYTVSANTTLNVAGYSITAKGSSLVLVGNAYTIGDGVLFTVNSGVNFTLTGSGTLKVYATSYFGDGSMGYAFSNSGNVTIEPSNGTLKIQSGNNMFSGSGTAVLKGGSYSSADNSALDDYVATGYAGTEDADGWYVVEKVTAANASAKIGDDNLYLTLDAAYKAANAGETITLLKACSTEISLSKAISYEGNYTLTTTGTISAGTFKCTVSVTGKVISGGSFQISPLTGNLVAGYKVSQNGELFDVIRDDTYVEAVIGNTNYWSFWDAVKAVNDGTATGDIKLLTDVTLNADNYMKTEPTYISWYGWVDYYYTFYLSKNATIDLNGHTLQLPNASYAVYYNGGTLTVKDGSDAKSGLFLFGDNSAYVVGDNALSLEGGSYNIDVASYCAYGYEANEVGDYYKVTERTLVAKIGDAKYYTLADAIAAVKSGETITLQVTGNTENIIIPVGVTIQLNSNTFAGTWSVPEGYILSNNENNDGKVYARKPNMNDSQTVAYIKIANDNTVCYMSLSAAVAAATSGQTIEVKKTNSENVTIPAGVSIHLNGLSCGTISVPTYCIKNTSVADYVSAVLRTVSDGGNVATVVYNGETHYHTSFENALADANSTTGATLTLIENCSYASNGSGLWNVTSSMTIDGNSKTLSGWGSRSGKYTTIAINNNGSSKIDVTLKNLTINNANTTTNNDRYVRPIETRGNITSLTLDNVNITAKNGTAMGVCIGGDQSSVATINISNSTIDVGNSGYGIVTYNPTTMTISNTNIYGFTALYLKNMVSSKGSAGSTINVTGNSYLKSYNPTNGGQNWFGTIVCEDGGITVNVENSTIMAECKSKNVTNSIFTSNLEGSQGNYNGGDKNGYNSTAANILNLKSGSKVNLTTAMRYFCDCDVSTVSQIINTYNEETGEPVSKTTTSEIYAPIQVNMYVGSVYNFIPVDQWMCYNHKADVYTMTCMPDNGNTTGVIANTNEDTKDDYPYTIGAPSGTPNPYNIVAYKGDEEEHSMDHVEAPSWEAQVAAKPNTVGIISGETYDAVTATAFAKSTNNIVVKYPVGDDDYAYVAPTFNVTDLTAEGIGTDYDKTDYYSPETFTASKGEFKRQLYSGCNSVCVPFDVDVDNTDLNGLHTHEILTYSTYSQVDGTVYFTYADHVDAGVPFIVLLQNNREWKVDFNNTEIIGKPESVKECAGVFQTTGDYGENEKGYYSVTSTGTFGVLADKLYPFRACFQLEGATAGSNGAAPRLGIMNAGQVTYVDEILANPIGSDKFMKDGKLYIRHNGQVYNAAGQLVK